MVGQSSNHLILDRRQLFVNEWLKERFYSFGGILGTLEPGSSKKRVHFSVEQTVEVAAQWSAQLSHASMVWSSIPAATSCYLQHSTDILMRVCT